MSDRELITKARTDVEYLRELLDSGTPIARGMLAYAITRLEQITNALEGTAPPSRPLSMAEQYREASTRG